MYDGDTKTAPQTAEGKPRAPYEPSLTVQRLRERIRRRQEAGPPRPAR